MPGRIDQEWFDGIIYLYPDTTRAFAGEQVGGTGFLISWPVANTGSICLWAVTNRHIIEEGGHWTIRMNRKSGGVLCIDTTDEEWVLSPDSDLAVRPMKLSKDIIDFRHIPTDWLLTKEWHSALDIGPGDICTTIGRFVGHDGRSRNYPTARFGQIAQNPNEPVKVGGKMQECFLVESRSIGGTSGSPVIVHLDPLYPRLALQGKTAPDGTALGPMHFPTIPWLLGVCFAMTPLWRPVCDSHRTELSNGWMVELNTGMMGVIPAWHIRELMESKHTEQARRFVEHQIEAESAQSRRGGEMSKTA